MNSNFKQIILNVLEIIEYKDSGKFFETLKEFVSTSYTNKVLETVKDSDNQLAFNSKKDFDDFLENSIEESKKSKIIEGVFEEFMTDFLENITPTLNEEKKRQLNSYLDKIKK